MALYVRSAGVYKNVSFTNYFQRNAGVYSTADELYVRNSGVYKLAWRADGPPPEPTSLTIGVANGGIVNVGWAYPANVENDYNRVEVQQPGDIARIGTNHPATTQQRTSFAHGTSLAFQVRTVDNGGQTSGWMSVSTSTTAINALPGPAVVSAFFWNGSTFTIQWTDPGNPYGDISAVQIWYKTSAEGTYTLGATHTTAGGLRSWNLAGRGWDINNTAFVRVVNAAGFRDSNVVSAWTPPAPGTEKTVAAYFTDSWAYTAAGYRGDGLARQGQFASTPYGNHFGMYFYGVNTLWNMGHGHQAASGEILMIREGTQGFTGTVWFESHGYGTPPVANPTGLDQQWASTSDFAGADASNWEPIPAAVRATIASGAAQGIGIYTSNLSQSFYRVFKGPSTNAFAGVVRLRW